MSNAKIVYGAFGLLGVLLLAGGCKTQVMRDRSYVPIDEQAPLYINQNVEETPQYLAQPEGKTSELVSETVAPTSKYPAYKPFAGVETPVVAEGSEYIVKRGDMISSIARKHKVSTNALLAANGLDLTSARRIRVGQKLIIPAQGAKFAPVVHTAVSGVKPTLEGGKYVVVANDNVAKIAHKLHVSPAALMAANNLNQASARRLQIGQKLVVPTKNSVVNTVKTAAKVSHAEAIRGGFYIVKSGDNIPKIARMLNVKASDLMAANNLDAAATRRLQIGQKLVVPGRGVAVAKPVVAKDTYTAPVAPKATEVVEVAETVVAPVAAPVDKATDDVLNNLETSLDKGAEVKDAVENIAAGPSTPIQTTDAMTIDEFAKKYNVSAQVLETYNGKISLVDEKIPANSIIFVPAK